MTLYVNQAYIFRIKGHGMKKYILKIISLFLVSCSITQVFASNIPFTDVDPSAWYTEAVKTVYQNGIMEGKDENIFDPTGITSRAELVTVICRLAGEDTAGMGESLSFRDTDSSAWYADSIAWAESVGIVTGYPDGSFKPNAPIQRQELAKVVVKFLEYAGIKVDGEGSAGFADTALFPEWSVEYIEKLRLTGLMIGDENGNFNHEKNTSRAEVAMLISRMLPFISADTTCEIVKDGKFQYTIVYDDNDPYVSEYVSKFVHTMRFEENLSIMAIKSSEAEKSYGREIIFGNVRPSASALCENLDPEGDFALCFKGDDIVLCTNDEELYPFLFKVFEVNIASKLENKSLIVSSDLEFIFSKSDVTHLSYIEYAVSAQCVSPTDVYEFFRLKEFTSSNGTVVDYRLFIPFDYTPEKKYPVLLSLHGMGENLVDESEGSTSTLLCMQNMFNLKNTPVTQAIIICPQYAEGDLAVELVEHVASQYSTDPDRYYLMGLSAGGAGTWMTIQMYPDYFAAAMPICGYGNIEDPSILVDVPLYVVHGVDDDVVGVGSSRTLVETVRNAGSKVIHYEEPEGYKHRVWHYPTKKIEIVEWMFSQRLSAR